MNFCFATSYILPKGKVVYYRGYFSSQVSVIIYASYNLLGYFLCAFVQVQHAQLCHQHFMKRSLDPYGNYFSFICFGVVFITQFIITYFVIAFRYVFTDVYIIIVIGTCLRFVFFVFVTFKFIHFIKFVIPFFSYFQCRVFFQFFFDALFQISGWHL